MNEQDIKRQFGFKLKNLRKKLGYTQDSFCSLINLDITNLSRLENGKSLPSFITFCNILEVLKIEPNYFLNFVPFDKNVQNYNDIEILENLNTLKDDVKININNLIKSLAK